LSFIKRNNLSTEEFNFMDDKADQWMSSLELGMKIRDRILNGEEKRLGEGQRGWEAHVYDEEGMWRVGAALEELVLDEHWDEGI
jgi:hypothetical protein